MPLKPLQNIAILLGIVVSSILNGAEPETAYLFINGGSSEMSNYSAHEETLESFYKTLFNETGTLLNAGGKGTLLLRMDGEGLLKRTELGWAEPEESVLPYPQKSATLSNVSEAFEGLKGKKKAVIVIGDHGYEGGVMLWNNEVLSPSKLRELQEGVGVDTLIRKIHLHCNSGASLVDPKRKPPATAGEFPEYLKKYFPKNACGFALSSHDEVGQYVGFGTPWEKSPVNNILKYKPLSLKKMKSLLAEDQKVQPIPLLTSDYLVEDLSTLFCQGGEQRATSTSPQASESGSAGRSIASRTHSAGSTSSNERYEATSPCSGPSPRLAEVERRFQKAKKVLGEISEVKHEAVRAVVEREEPKLVEAAEKALGEIEKLKAEFLLVRNPTAKRQKEYEEKIAKLREGAVQAYEHRMENVGSGYIAAEAVYNEYKSESFQKWLKENEKAFPNIFEADKNGKSDIWRMLSEAAQEFDAAQKVRKGLHMARQQKLRKFVETQLKDPKQKALKEVYDGISKCEDSDLR